jgi:serine/threonine protein kinase
MTGQAAATIRPEAGLLIAGRYELVRELGRGGMGAVWSAHDRIEPRTVAVKFQKGVGVEDGNERRFAREADALCRLSCPHVVRFFYSGRERGLSFIVMEHLLGHTLRRRLELSGHLHAREVAALIWQAAIGLGSAHRAGIVHRDVKPSNLFLTADAGNEVLKVIDFGIAKGRGLDASTAGSGAVGSPGYMSPEQALGERVDHRSDVWALAVVAFKALCGKEPFTAENVPATLERIWRGQALRLTSVRPDLPPALDAFFARAFVQDPTHRFQSTSELAVHFERAIQGVSLEPPGRLSKTKSLPPSGPGQRLSPFQSFQPPAGSNRDGALASYLAPPPVSSNPAHRMAQRRSDPPSSRALYPSPLQVAPASAAATRPSRPPAAKPSGLPLALLLLVVAAVVTSAALFLLWASR